MMQEWRGLCAGREEMNEAVSAIGVWVRIRTL